MDTGALEATFLTSTKETMGESPIEDAAPVKHVPEALPTFVIQELRLPPALAVTAGTVPSKASPWQNAADRRSAADGGNAGEVTRCVGESALPASITTANGVSAEQTGGAGNGHAAAVAQSNGRESVDNVDSSVAKETAAGVTPPEKKQVLTSAAYRELLGKSSAVQQNGTGKENSMTPALRILNKHPEFGGWRCRRLAPRGDERHGHRLSRRRNMKAVDCTEDADGSSTAVLLSEHSLTSTNQTGRRNAREDASLRRQALLHSDPLLPQPGLANGKEAKKPLLSISACPLSDDATVMAKKHPCAVAKYPQKTGSSRKRSLAMPATDELLTTLAFLSSQAKSENVLSSSRKGLEGKTKGKSSLEHAANGDHTYAHSPQEEVELSPVSMPPPALASQFQNNHAIDPFNDVQAIPVVVLGEGPVAMKDGCLSSPLTKGAVLDTVAEHCGSVGAKSLACKASRGKKTPDGEFDNDAESKTTSASICTPHRQDTVVVAGGNEASVSAVSTGRLPAASLKKKRQTSAKRAQKMVQSPLANPATSSNRKGGRGCSTGGSKQAENMASVPMSIAPVQSVPSRAKMSPVETTPLSFALRSPQQAQVASKPATHAAKKSTPSESGKNTSKKDDTPGKGRKSAAARPALPSLNEIAGNCPSPFVNTQANDMKLPSGNASTVKTPSLPSVSYQHSTTKMFKSTALAVSTQSSVTVATSRGTPTRLAGGATAVASPLANGPTPQISTEAVQTGDSRSNAGELEAPVLDSEVSGIANCGLRRSVGKPNLLAGNSTSTAQPGSIADTSAGSVSSSCALTTPASGNAQKASAKPSQIATTPSSGIGNESVLLPTILDSMDRVFAGPRATLGQETGVLTRSNTVTASSTTAVPSRHCLASHLPKGTSPIATTMLTTQSRLPLLASGVSQDWEMPGMLSVTIGDRQLIARLPPTSKATMQSLGLGRDVSANSSCHESTEHQPPRGMSVASSSASASNSTSWLSATVAAAVNPPPLTPLLAPGRRHPEPGGDPVTACSTVSAPVLEPMTASSKVVSAPEEAEYIMGDAVGSDSVPASVSDGRAASGPPLRSPQAPVQPVPTITTRCSRQNTRSYKKRQAVVSQSLRAADVEPVCSQSLVEPLLCAAVNTGQVPPPLMRGLLHTPEAGPGLRFPGSRPRTPLMVPLPGSAGVRQMSPLQIGLLQAGNAIGHVPQHGLLGPRFRPSMGAATAQPANSPPRILMRPNLNPAILAASSRLLTSAAVRQYAILAGLANAPLVTLRAPVQRASTAWNTRPVLSAPSPVPRRNTTASTSTWPAGTSSDALSSSASTTTSISIGTLASCITADGVSNASQHLSVPSSHNSCTGVQSSAESKTLDGKPVVNVSCNGLTALPASVSATLLPSPTSCDSTPAQALSKSVSGGGRRQATSTPEIVDSAEAPPNCQTFAGLPSTTPTSCVALSPTRVYSEVTSRIFSSPSPKSRAMLPVDAGTELQTGRPDCTSAPCSFAAESCVTLSPASVISRKLSASGLLMSIKGSALCGVNDAAVATTLSACDNPVVPSAIIDLTVSSDDDEIDLNRPGLVLASEVSTATAASSSSNAGQQTSGQSMSTENIECVLAAYQGTAATCLTSQTANSNAISRRSARKPLSKQNPQTTTLVWSSHLTPCARVSDDNSAAIRNREADDVGNTDSPLLPHGDGHPWQKEYCLLSALPVEGLDTLAALDQAANSLPVYSKSNVPTSEPTTQTSIGLLSPVPSQMAVSVSVTVTSPTSPTTTPYLSMTSATMVTSTPASHPPPGKGSTNPGDFAPTNDVTVSAPGEKGKKREVSGRRRRLCRLASPLSLESPAASSPAKSPVHRPQLRRSTRGRPAVVPLPDDAPVSEDRTLRTDTCNSSGEVLTPDSWVSPLHVEVTEALEKENTATNDCIAVGPDSEQCESVAGQSQTPKTITDLSTITSSQTPRPLFGARYLPNVVLASVRVPAPLCDFEKKYRQALHGLMVGAARSARTGKDCADALKLVSRKKRCPAGAYPPVNTGHEYILREGANTIVIEDDSSEETCARLGGDVDVALATSIPNGTESLAYSNGDGGESCMQHNEQSVLHTPQGSRRASSRSSPAPSLVISTPLRINGVAMPTINQNLSPPSEEEVGYEVLPASLLNSQISDLRLPDFLAVNCSNAPPFLPEASALVTPSAHMCRGSFEIGRQDPTPHGRRAAGEIDLDSAAVSVLDPSSLKQRLDDVLSQMPHNDEQSPSRESAVDTPHIDQPATPESKRRKYPEEEMDEEGSSIRVRQAEILREDPQAVSVHKAGLVAKRTASNVAETTYRSLNQGSSPQLADAYDYRKRSGSKASSQLPRNPLTNGELHPVPGHASNENCLPGTNDSNTSVDGMTSDSKRYPSPKPADKPNKYGARKKPRFRRHRSRDLSSRTTADAYRTMMNSQKFFQSPSESPQKPAQEASEAKFIEPAVQEHNGQPIYSRRRVARVRRSIVITDGVGVFMRERLSEGYFEEKAGG